MAPAEQAQAPEVERKVVPSGVPAGSRKRKRDDGGAEGKVARDEEAEADQQQRGGVFKRLRLWLRPQVCFLLAACCVRVGSLGGGPWLAASSRSA